MSQPEPINPYQSPQADPSRVDIMPADRRRALWRIRRALLILAMPCALNLYCLHFVFPPHRPRGAFYDFRTQFMTLNSAATFLLCVGVWFFALTFIEWVALVLHRLFGGGLSRGQWLSCMYDSLWPLVPACFLGSFVWWLWLDMTYYYGRFPWFTVSVVCGTIGHLLAAWVYGTVLFNWYRLRRQGVT